jgi:hypothetical protein
MVLERPSVISRGGPVTGFVHYSFDPRPVLLGFVADNLTLELGYSTSSSVFPLSISFYQSSVCTFILKPLLSEGQAGEASVRSIPSHSSVICHTTGPQPLPKRLFLERDSAGKVIMW